MSRAAVITGAGSAFPAAASQDARLGRAFSTRTSCTAARPRSRFLRGRDRHPPRRRQPPRGGHLDLVDRCTDGALRNRGPPDRRRGSGRRTSTLRSQALGPRDARRRLLYGVHDAGHRRAAGAALSDGAEPAAAAHRPRRVSRSPAGTRRGHRLRDLPTTAGGPRLRRVAEFASPTDDDRSRPDHLARVVQRRRCLPHRRTARRRFPGRNGSPRHRGPLERRLRRRHDLDGHRPRLPHDHLAPRPRITRDRGIAPLVDQLLERNGLCRSDVDAWAVLPGGPRILDVVEAALGLDDGALAISRRVLRQNTATAPLPRCSWSSMPSTARSRPAPASTSSCSHSAPGLLAYGALMRTT